MQFKDINTPRYFKILFIPLVIGLSIIIFLIPFNKNIDKHRHVLITEYLSIHNISDITTIKNGYVEPVIFEDIEGLPELDMNDRKKAFIELLLPSILIVKNDIHKERLRTLDVWGKLKSHQNITSGDSLFMEGLFNKYDTKNFAEIYQKQEVHPNSIILAQSALETGWGTSRFLLHGNNAFGIWSYDRSDDRMMSMMTRDEGIIIYLKKYDNIKESVEDYFRTVANSWAFDQFRKRRAETNNAWELIWYLNKYSELRNDYVKKIGELMVQNQLTRYDTMQLDPRKFISMKVRR